MTRTTTRATLLIAGLLAAGIASAQVPTSTLPGDATTRANGQINPTDKSPKTSATTRAAVNADARMANSTDKNKTTAMGDATTTGPNGEINGRPASERNPSGMSSVSRAQVNGEARRANTTDKNKTTGMGDATTTGPNGQINMTPAPAR